MKKKILSIALVLAGLMGSSAMAQSPSTTQQATQTVASAPNAKKMANPFEGLNLSEKQQAELKALREGLPRRWGCIRIPCRTVSPSFCGRG